jgi:hypothetical protein
MPCWRFFRFWTTNSRVPRRIAKPNRQSESIARRHRPQSGWLSRFFDPANRVAPAATHARNGRQATVP